MLMSLAVAFGLVMVGVVAYSELRSANCGTALSNGMEVLVSPEMYRAIVDRYRSLEGLDASRRWDQAILDVLRPVRPNEYRFLARSLGFHRPGEGLVTRRARQTVHG
jgi:hypothetical protein